MEWLKESIIEWLGPTPIILSVIILAYVQGMKAKLKKIEKTLDAIISSD